MFFGRKHAGSGIGAGTVSSACKKQGSFLPRTTLPAFARGLKTKIQKRNNNLAGEGKGSDIDIERITDVLIGDGQKMLPSTITYVEKRDTEGRGGRRKIGPYGCKCRTNGVGGVICDWECSSLAECTGDVSKKIKIIGTKAYFFTTAEKLFRKFVEIFSPTGDQGNPVAFPSEETPR